MHTGNTPPRSCSNFCFAVHPRAYGEHASSRRRHRSHNGSSPCIRGTRKTVFSGPATVRFIPVHTGNTKVVRFTKRVPAVHPRAYGEHFASCRFRAIRTGSSPCIRGTLHYFSVSTGGIRFIPVHTGNTSANVTTSSSDSVHPRAYGEHQMMCSIRSNMIGSSPCIRGTRLGRFAHCQHIRFIPVHTGNTPASISLMAVNTVHPRAYGEHARKAARAKAKSGSSPCIRGTQGSRLQ